MSHRVDEKLRERAEVHAALGEPVRLGIVEDLVASDRSPGELAERHHLSSSLLAHHLDTLERVGLIERRPSSGDARRRYVTLDPRRLDSLLVGPTVADDRIVFVCTHNSARSQLAAALWTRTTGAPADSAGTHPAERVHPGAVAAARRAGLDLSDARPRLLDPAQLHDTTVVTVCDQAHEELDPETTWLHWSIPDPVPLGTDAAFEDALTALEGRIGALTSPPPTP
ncbi:MarR family transcriptional regulator [Rhabdothermincola salaria]|uniref:arsenate reductase/protein-tyrosine-phosphatase family protein n=1 Tax=Rhabdothermincola salaria TaxID=2903142 RepID=UPI001E415F5F|nr:helix-turn-helix domain-containing protein [Rhabdothermincola salaria]MCD9624591.1 helix-turn-helix domain-containing protein [Rhabdothermincola salaria]